MLLRNLATMLHSERDDFQESHGTLGHLGHGGKQHAGIQVGTDRDGSESVESASGLACVSWALNLRPTRETGLASHPSSWTASLDPLDASRHHKLSLAQRFSGSLGDSSIALDTNAWFPRGLCPSSTPSEPMAAACRWQQHCLLSSPSTDRIRF